MKLKINYKTTASIMVSAILAVIVWIGIAQSMAMVANSSFKSIKSGRTALQAQQYADISIDRLKNINYDELDINGAHSRKKIEGISSDDWQDEVTIGAESTIAGSDDAKQRIATVNVYKVGDTMPRYTVEVPLSSQTNRGEFVGTIIPRMNDKFASEYEANQYLLCDGSTFDTTKYKRLYQILGSNQLPNLQGMFLRGHGSQASYSSGELGKIQGDAMRKIYGDIPSVQHGETIFGTYTPGAFQLAGKWNMTVDNGRAYGENRWYLKNFTNYRYRLSGNKESGYWLQEYAETEDFQVLPETSRFGPDIPVYGSKAYRTITLDSSKIVPTDTEIRPANVAVKYFIRAR